MGLLDGKVAIVTGAGAGIGRSHAHLLAKEGASVIVNDFGWKDASSPAPVSNASIVADEINAAGGRAVANVADVADWVSTQEMVEQALAEIGRLDIVVCNAGIVRDRFVHNMTEGEFDAVIRNHLNGHFALTHHAAVLWRTQFKQTGEPSNGRLIYTGSEAGMFGNMGQINYSAAKAGIFGMCLEVSKEFGRFGATVNAISPRARSPMTKTTFGEIDVREGDFDVWDSDNISPIVAFLASDEAAKVNGQIFVTYGGVVRVMQPWVPLGEVHQSAKWDPRELGEALKSVLPGLKAEPPQMPDIGIQLIRA